MPPGFAVILLLIALIGFGVSQLVFLVLDAGRNAADWAVAARRLVWRPFRLRDAGGVAALLGGVAVVLLLALGEPGRGAPEPRLTFGHLLLNFVCFQGVLVAAVLLLARRRGVRWADAFGDAPGPRWPWISQVFRYFLALLPLIVLTGLLTQQVLRMLGIPPETQEILDVLTSLDSPAKLAAGVAFAVIGAPLSEELFFRGLLLPALARRVGVPAAVAASSLLFAAIHFQPQQMPVLFLLSVALSLVAIQTRRLESAILLHAVFNGFMITLAILTAGHAPV